MKFYKLSGTTFFDLINSIYQFIKPFLDNEMSVFEEYGAFKGNENTFYGKLQKLYLHPV